ncbi:hypothetical protein ACFQ5N_02360 [Lutibacter holmesii]|uniref:Uncharacterized protein n=1 Tax=Lutibacter holmesii TaxID=1137985 RepID=A0ABW3WKI8_9FLAO
MVKKVMAKVKRTYKKPQECNNKELCYPEDWFENIEKCKKCNKLK